MVYGYARVSSRSQRIEGCSIEKQTDDLKKAGAEKIYIDTFTGSKMSRPNLSELLSIIESGDILMVTRLDRFARSVSQASEQITNLVDRGIKIHVLNWGVLDNTSMSMLIRNMLLSFAQFERDMIIERTQEGREIARTRPNYVEGRPKKYRKQQIDLAVKLLNDYSYNQVSLMTGISVSTLVREKRKCKSVCVKKNCSYVE